MLKKLFVIAVLFFIPVFGFSEEESKVVPFTVGEKLHFDLYIGLILAGKATLAVQDIVEINGHKTYHCVLKLKSTKGFSKIFFVDDTIETFIDVDKLFPRRYISKIRHGKRHKDHLYELDQDNGIGHFTSFNKGKKIDFQLEQGAQDTLSLIYYIRSLNYRVGDRRLIPVMSNRKNYAVKIFVARKVRKSIYGGRRYDTFELSSKAEFEGSFLQGKKGRMWLSLDERKLPVCIRSSLPVGSMTLALVKVEDGENKEKEYETNIDIKKRE